MSIFKAFFGLGKIPQVVKFFEFKSFDDVNKMGGAIAQIKQQVREGGLQLTKAQQKFLDDQMKQVEMVFEQLQQPTKETGIRGTQSAKIFDLQGQEIPQGSKIMGGKAVDDTKMIDDAIENTSPGFVKGDTKYNAELVAEDLAERMGLVYDDLDTRQRIDIYGKAYDRLSKRNFQVRQTEKQIAERLGRENKKAVGNIRKKKLRDEISKLDDKIEARKLQLEQRGVEDFETDSLFNKLDEQRNDLELKLDFEDMVDPENMAQGGRAGFKDGMSRRKFMQIMGGLAALPIVGKFFKAGKVAAPAVEAAKETVTQAPSYFFDLVNKIKMFGKEGIPIGPRKRTVNYKNYELTEDISTGDITIVKQKGDPDFAYEEEVMLLRKGQADETTKGRTPPDEYEELTVRPDMEGKMKDVEDGIEPEGIQEIIQEASGEAPSIKKAGGGIARMLGE